MSGFPASPINPGNFHIRLTVRNGGQVRFWRSAERLTFVFTIDPSGQISQSMIGENGMMESNVIGYFTPMEQDVPIVMLVDGCQSSVSFFYQDKMNLVATYSNPDFVNMTYMDGTNGGFANADIKAEIRPKAEVCFLRQNGSGSTTAGLPWWIWLIIGIAAFFVLLVIIFASIATANSGKKTTTTTEQVRTIRNAL